MVSIKGNSEHKPFAEVLIDMMKDYGLSQEELVSRMPVKKKGNPVVPQDLNNVMHGWKALPSKLWRRRLAAGFGITEDMLLHEWMIRRGKAGEIPNLLQVDSGYIAGNEEDRQELLALIKSQAARRLANKK